MMAVLFCGDTDRLGDCHPPPFSLLTFWVIFFTILTLELGWFSRNEERHVQSQEFSIFLVDSGKKITKEEGVERSCTVLWHCAGRCEQMSPHPRKETNDRLMSNYVNECILLALPTGVWVRCYRSRSGSERVASQKQHPTLGWDTAHENWKTGTHCTAYR